jgi:methyl-accepting chemotaxis protein
MAQYMCDTIGLLKTATLKIASSAEQLQNTSAEMLTGIDTMASQAHSVATAGNEMATTAGDIARKVCKGPALSGPLSFSSRQ